MLMLSEAWHEQTDQVLVCGEKDQGLINWKNEIQAYFEDDPDVEVVEGDKYQR